jgi:hypothetical protein
MDTNKDKHLSDGPFTDFGQFGSGRLDLRVFLQSKYWVDKEGRGHLLTSMSNEYRRNVIQMLLVNAKVLHLQILFLIIGTIHDAGANQDATFMESFLTIEIPLLDFDNSYEFIENTPLMNRLRELEPNGPTLGDLLIQEVQK